MSQYNILICDDSAAVHETLERYFEKEDIASVSVYDGEAALREFKKQNFDLIILDIMLPRLAGTDVCREIRKTSDVPIVFLSAKGEEFDRIIGLELGADDYVTKPFSSREVVARVKAILRRTQGKGVTELALGNLTVNKKAYKVAINGKAVKMTPREIELLAFLISNKGEVVTRDAILDSVWGEDYYGDVRAVDTLIARVRSKIPEMLAGVEFHSVYGVGYSIDVKQQ